MGNNLTGQTIASTYEDLVQISGSVLTDGLGNEITNLTATASYATTASFALNGGGGATVDTGSLLTTASISNDTITFTKGDASTFNIVVNNVSNASTASIATFATSAGTASLANTATLAVSASHATTASYATFAASASHAANADNAITASHALGLADGLSLNVANLTASGITTTNLTATSASIGYLQTVTGSAIIIGDAFILLNTSNATRYAGLKVEDSGSAIPVNYTSSWYFDSLLNDWNYSYSSSNGLDYAVALFGPHYSTQGTPTYLTANTIPKADGTHHLNDSNISDDGTLVTINANVSASGYISSSEFVGNLTGNATSATSASFATTASFYSLANVNQNAVFSGSVRGEVNALSIASQTASMDLSTGNFFTLELPNADTHLVPSNIQAGQTVNLKVTHTSTSSGSLSYSSAFTFAGGTPFVITEATSSVDVMTFISFNGSSLQATGLQNFS